jgi:hypothetical protein
MDTLPPVLNELSVHRYEFVTHSVIASAQLPQRTCTLHMLHLQLLHITSHTTICIRGGTFRGAARNGPFLASPGIVPPRMHMVVCRNFSRFVLVHVAVVSVHQLEHVDDGVRGQLPPPSGSCRSQ